MSVKHTTGYLPYFSQHTVRLPTGLANITNVIYMYHRQSLRSLTCPTNTHTTYNMKYVSDNKQLKHITHNILIYHLHETKHGITYTNHNMQCFYPYKPLYIYSYTTYITNLLTRITTYITGIQLT